MRVTQGFMKQASLLAFSSPRLRGELGFRVKRESRVRGRAQPLTQLAPYKALATLSP